MPELPSIAHVTLTVSDPDRSVPWYERLFDTKLVLDEEPGPFRRAVWIVGGQTLIGLHEFPDLTDTRPFTERRVGLDHLAIACANRSDEGCNRLGIVNGGIVDAGYGSGLSFRDPDNIALEILRAAAVGRCDRHACARPNPRGDGQHVDVPDL